MKIGIDGIPLSRNKTGVGNYVFYHLENLIELRKFDHFYIYSPRNHPNLEYFKKFKNVTIRVNSFLSQSDALWSQTSLSYCCYKDQIDCFWGTSQSLPIINFHQFKKIITVYDFTYLLFPETVSTYKKIYLKLLSKKMLRKAHAYTVISKGTGRLLEKFYGHKQWMIITPPIKKEIRSYSKIEVDQFLQQYQLEYNNYILSISTLEPRKNLLQLVEIYHRLLKAKSLSQMRPLILIGGDGWKNHDLLNKLNQMQQEYPSHIRYLGYLDDDALSRFLSGAAYYIMFSKYEGYGMPLAEARVCHTPVICPESSEMFEASEGDALFVNENNAFEIIEKASQFSCSSSFKPVIKNNYKNNVDIAKCLSTVLDCP